MEMSRLEPIRSFEDMLARIDGPEITPTKISNVTSFHDPSYINSTPNNYINITYIQDESPKRGRVLFCGIHFKVDSFTPFYVERQTIDSVQILNSGRVRRYEVKISHVFDDKDRDGHFRILNKIRKYIDHACPIRDLGIFIHNDGMMKTEMQLTSLHVWLSFPTQMKAILDKPVEDRPKIEVYLDPIFCIEIE